MKVTLINRKSGAMVQYEDITSIDTLEAGAIRGKRNGFTVFDFFPKDWTMILGEDFGLQKITREVIR